MAAKYPSDNEDESSSKQDVRLCIADEKNPGSCIISSCYDFHLCRDYLLTNKCNEFETKGYCSRCHSLYTKHNQKVLEKKFQTIANDEDIFDRIAKYVRSPQENKSIRSRFLTNGDDFDDDNLHSKSSTKSVTRFLPIPSISNSSSPGKAPVTFRTTSTTMKSIPSHHHHSVPPPSADIDTELMLTNSSASGKDPKSSSTSLGFDFPSKSSSNSRKSLNILDNGGSRTRVSVCQQDDRDDEASSPHSRSSLLGFKFPTKVSKLVDTMTGKSHSNGHTTSSKDLKYVFDKYYQKDHLSYLFGPIRRQLNEKQKFQIFASGYCRVRSSSEEKDIEKELEQAMKVNPTTTDVKLPNDLLTLVASTSAAERIFEQEQKCFGIISESHTHIFQIEVIGKSLVDQTGSTATTISSRLSPKPVDSHTAVPVNRLDLHGTNSSIEVIQGDITKIHIDMIVCVTTSQHLLSNVLQKAGQSVTTEYKTKFRTDKEFVLSGGFTLANKILFAPWELEVRSMDDSYAQKSLSDFVTDCITIARNHNMTSIAFPSIGTGDIHMSPDKVCEAMITAASDCLRTQTLNVRFVIFPSRTPGVNSQLYDTFCNYLGELNKQNHSSASGHAAVGSSEKTRRFGECKRISIVSDTADTSVCQNKVIHSLESLIETKTVDLRYIQKPSLNQLDFLIEFCLGYHIIPCIDFMKGVLILRGDRDSCSQCFANLRNERKVSRYFLQDKRKKTDPYIPLNTYLSLKIHEGLTNLEQDIHIRDNSETVFDVNFNDFTVRINHNAQTYTLVGEQLNTPNKSTSSPLLTILTKKLSSSLYDELEFLPEFKHSMSRLQCKISEIHTINNWPLHAYYLADGDPHDETFAYYSCAYSSVQSIIHYGLHSNYARPSENALQIHKIPMNSHVYNGYRSTDGKYYMFVVQIARKHFSNDIASLTNDNAHWALPKYLIVYEQQ